MNSIAYITAAYHYDDHALDDGKPIPEIPGASVAWPVVDHDDADNIVIVVTVKDPRVHVVVENEA